MFDKWTRFLPRKNKKDVDNAIRFIVTHAYQNVPFYRKYYDRCGIDPSGIRSAEDLVRLPIINRLNMMVGGPSEYLSKDASPEKLVIRHTTGTTGTPVVVHKTRIEEFFRKLTIVDAFQRNVALTCPMTLVDVGPERKDSSTEIFVNRGPLKIVRIFRTLPIDEQIKILMSIKPTVMSGRPSMFWDLVNALREKNIAPPMPKLITCGAEILFPHIKKQIGDFFHCRVADYYNCEEVGNLAWECPANPGLMHPNPATVWLETVDNQGIPVPADREGHILVTNLFNCTMPFIRYEMGDRGTLLQPGLCQCGFNGPIMRLTEGRCENYIVLPDGREITPRIIYEVINSAFPHDQPGWSMIEAIRQYQIIQEIDDMLLIRFVPGPKYTESLWPAVEKNIKLLHPDMRMKTIKVDEIRAEPGKKLHMIIGKLSSRWKSERIDDSDA